MYSKHDPYGMNQAYKLMGTAIGATTGLAVTYGVIGAVKALKP